MQQNKVTNKSSELELLTSNSEKLTSSLLEVMDKFKVKKHLEIFDVLKSKGLALSSLLSILLILPFYGAANVNQLMKQGIKKLDIEGKKTTFYDTKNNEFINWRKLLMLHVKRFIYLINNNINLKSTKTTAIIFDDTLIKKTGKKIERVSSVYDHVSCRFILGYKLLVCGFWDGASFIPIDFSLHRERGNKHEGLIKEHHSLGKKIENQKVEIESLEEKKDKNDKKLANQRAACSQKSSKANVAKLEKLVQKESVIQVQITELKKQNAHIQKLKEEAYKKLKRFYSSDYMFGLTAKERKEQFRKAVSTKSHGFRRRKESDKSKIDSMLDMLGRAVKSGIVPKYVLIDSWFFCYQVLEKLAELKKGAIKLVAMVKVHNLKFTLCQTGKELPTKVILKTNEQKMKRCKKHKAQYISLKCLYKGIRVNLFFVRMGANQNWHLLLTTDLNLSFIEVMEIYQIRWSIEVFFKESKQYMNLSNCSSNIFDAQIADITISMMQYIMLIYFKRLNHQQSIGGLFKDISDELVELDLVTRIISIFWELVEILCQSCSIDLIELQQDMLRNEKIMQKFQELLPQRVLQKVA